MGVVIRDLDFIPDGKPSESFSWGVTCLTYILKDDTWRTDSMRLHSVSLDFLTYKMGS